MSDRELLELAAKAAGIKGEWRERHNPAIYGSTESSWGIFSYPYMWNPLENDSDALQLAAAIDVFGSRDDLLKFYSWMADALVVIDGQAAAFRRAITCYAAEIGKQNPA